MSGRTPVRSAWRPSRAPSPRLPHDARTVRFPMTRTAPRTTNRTPNATRTLAACLLALSPGCITVDVAPHPVTPQRPTYSSDPNTTPEGRLELEAGVASDPGDRLDTPTTLKLGVDPRTELFLGLNPYQRADIGPRDVADFGDTVIGARHRFLEDGRTAAALQLAVKLPTGDEDEGLSSDEIDLFVAGTASRAFDAFALTLYYELGALGETSSGGFDLQHAFAAAASRSITDRFGVFAEGTALGSPEVEDAAFVTTGVTFAVYEGLVFDAAVQVDVNNADDLFVFGLTKSLGVVR